MTSYKPEFLVDGKWYDNLVRFATEAEAEEDASRKFAVWYVPTDYRVTETTDEVNYRLVDGQSVSLDYLKEGESHV